MSVPHVSFIMPAFNAGPYIEAAIKSALEQDSVSVEVIVVDDASTDDTAARVTAMAQRDPRIVLLQHEIGRGAAAARNTALRHAQGIWIAPLDADDLVLSCRTAHLIAIAETFGCEIATDNLLCFLDEHPSISWPFLPPRSVPHPVRINLDDYLLRNRMLYGTRNLGYLNSIFRRNFCLENNVFYNEDLRIGEDFDFCLRLLVCGARFILSSEASYLYRIRGSSLSRQLTGADVCRMIEAYESLPQIKTGSSPSLRVVGKSYRQSLEEALHYIELREAARAREWWRLLQILSTKFHLWCTLTRLVRQKLSRRLEMLHPLKPRFITPWLSFRESMVG